MNAAENAREELAALDLEESRILRELEQLDEKATNAVLSKQRHAGGGLYSGGGSNSERRNASSSGGGGRDYRSALNAILGECEVEVREAKGYISSSGPPLRIARCKRGEGIPNHATYLSRPKGTGVDFTIPVGMKEYNSIVKHPVFLNQIRDKCAANRYTSPEEYLADMKLLAKNTALFNKGQELAWVVQHSNLLLECAQEAVGRRMHRIKALNPSSALRTGTSSKTTSGKRKRSSDLNGTSSLTVGTVVQIFWDDDRRWHTGTIKSKSDGSTFEIEYEGSREVEWLDLDKEAKWRLYSQRSKRIENANKRKKSSTISGSGGGSTNNNNATAVVPSNVVTKDDLAALREEILGGIEDSKHAILNTVQSKFVSVENKISRSDALHRVLIAVGDIQQSVEGHLDDVHKNFEELQKSVQELANHIGYPSGNKNTTPTPAPAPCDKNNDNANDMEVVNENSTPAQPDAGGVSKVREETTDTAGNNNNINENDEESRAAIGDRTLQKESEDAQVMEIDQQENNTAKIPAEEAKDSSTPSKDGNAEEENRNGPSERISDAEDQETEKNTTTAAPSTAEPNKESAAGETETVKKIDAVSPSSPSHGEKADQASPGTNKESSPVVEKKGTTDGDRAEKRKGDEEEVEKSVEEKRKNADETTQKEVVASEEEEEIKTSVVEKEVEKEVVAEKERDEGEKEKKNDSEDKMKDVAQPEADKKKDHSDDEERMKDVSPQGDGAKDKENIIINTEDDTTKNDTAAENNKNKSGKEEEVVVKKYNNVSDSDSVSSNSSSSSSDSEDDSDDEKNNRNDGEDKMEIDSANNNNNTNDNESATHGGGGTRNNNNGDDDE